MNAPIDVTNVFIETPRLILRPWQKDDLADFYEYAKVDGVGQMAGWLPHENLETTQQVLSSFMEHKKVLALEEKQTGKVIGSLGIEANDHDHMGPHLLGREIGYVLSKAYWGQGLMPEAVKAVMDYCFTVLDYDYLLCGHFLWNRQSARVVEKCGFRYLKDIMHTTRYGTEEATKLYVLYNPNK